MAQRQGLSDGELASYQGAKIRRDSRGVVHIHGESWLAVVEAQGFVTAAERMFQMDLMRRKADGGLSELFGKAALTFDREQRKEDWRFYASEAVQRLATTERQTCEAYSRGVNKFISDYSGRVGIEYSILRREPTPWTCVDTFLIVLLMTDDMSHSWSRDLDIKAWHDALPQEWFHFVYPLQHPWNKPWFITETKSPSKITVPKDALPETSLNDDDFKNLVQDGEHGISGSNSWAYRGRKGAWLANDPHLGNQVPQLWIPTRLSTTDGWWIVGTALPGAPGILIGMNAHLAWSITNTCEDVDDAVIEEGTAGLATELREIKIKGSSSEQITVQKSKDGPVVKNLSDGRAVVRKWLAMKPGILSLPIEELNHASDWPSFNKAIDQFKFVPLNFTMMDRSKNMGLRISGCDISRQNNGSYAELAQNSAWADDCPTENRRRLFNPADNGQDSAYISTANERLWVDERLHNFVDDDRAARIHDRLSGSPDLTAEDMKLIQLDTTTRFHRELLMWLLKNGTSSYLTTAQKNDWSAWDGNIRSCPLCMSEASDAAKLVDHIILKKVSKHFKASGSDLPQVKQNMSRVRVVNLMESTDTAKSLGINPQQLATGVMKVVARLDAKKTTPWQLRNRWAAQHPFVGRIPIIGDLFRVEDHPQYGAGSVLRAENPNHGPSTRLIWDLTNQEASTWSFPLGLSGHPLSEHYRDWSKLWQLGGTMAVPVGE